MRRIFSIMLMVIVMTINIIFWATMLALVSWSVVFLTGALHNLFSTPALSFWQSVGVLLALLCLISSRCERGGQRKARTASNEGLFGPQENSSP